MRLFSILALLVLLTLSAPAATIIFQDGFNGSGTGSFTTLPGGSTLGPWTVGGLGIDWIGGYWVPQEGDSSVDLSALGSGSVTANLTTVAGQLYAVTFWLAGNTDGGNTIKSVQVLADLLNQTFTFDTTGYGKPNMGWLSETTTFTASNTGITPLTFNSLENNPFGPAIDNVTVSAVPEPATCALAAAGLFGLALLRRRRA